MPAPILVQADRMSPDAFGTPVFDEGRLCFKVIIDSFDVVLRIRPQTDGWTTQRDGAVLVGAYDCTVDVSRDEIEEIPAVMVTASGGRDFTARSPYFQARAAAYGGVAKSCLGRFLAFVRFRLGQPLIWGPGDSPPRLLRLVDWLDEAGLPINTGFQAIGLSVGSARSRGWRTDPLTASHEPALCIALVSEAAVPLHHELAAQGKDAALQGDLRRAVMELAISAEIAVKQAFFAPSSAAGEAFEYFEDKNLVRIGAIELLKEPARRAFVSFPTSMTSPER